MFHALFRLIASRPQLLAEHAEGYADLIAQEVQAASARWKRSLMLGAVGGVSALVALLMLGTALMLWAVTPDASMRAPWLLWVVPAVPAVVAIGCLSALSGQAKGGGFASLREQLAADAAMLREVSAP
ncbi:MAG: hypothetical protein IIZ92_00570 [Aquincola sp.]|uniref:hypothetical protein n=1 Tax=uncultured Aquincola sp. TaxID=886556 RepID=UPI0032B20591|nr:hypothetical protein [Aquincola sp.]|tara:strand:- start:4324 stop:4707 length:384 start_codon:yes stop_codon:yes gene_type:complete